MRSCRDVSKYQSLWANQGKNRQCVRVWQTAKAKWCCSGRCSDGVTCFCVAATTEERKGRTREGGGETQKTEKAANVMEIPGQSHACSAPGGHRGDDSETTAEPCALSDTGVEETLEPDRLLGGERTAIRMFM